MHKQTRINVQRCEFCKRGKAAYVAIEIVAASISTGTSGHELKTKARPSLACVNSHRKHPHAQAFQIGELPQGIDISIEIVAADLPMGTGGMPKAFSIGV